MSSAIAGKKMSSERNFGLDTVIVAILNLVCGTRRGRIAEEDSTEPMEKSGRVARRTRKLAIWETIAATGWGSKFGERRVLLGEFVSRGGSSRRGGRFGLLR